MSLSLSRFTYELIYNALPFQSNRSTYADVESDVLFENCRTILFNVASVHDIDPIVQETLRLVDIITKKEDSASLSTSVLHSLVVLLRLLSDVAEAAWREQERRICGESKKDDTTEDDDFNMSTKHRVGFATQQLCFHTVRPRAIESQTAVQVLKTAMKLKFDSNITKALGNISSAQVSSPSQGVDLPSTGREYKSSDSERLVGIIDANFDYILRFISASNPQDYQDFLDSAVIKPLGSGHTANEAEILHHLDLFSYYFITSQNLASFLQMISAGMSGWKKSIYQELTIMFSSQALTSWILSRPMDYQSLVDNTLASKNGTENVTKLASSLFDEIYSSFNVSSLLTMTANSNAAITEYKNSPSASEEGTPVSSSGKPGYFSLEHFEPHKALPLSKQGSQNTITSYALGWDFMNSAAVTGVLYDTEDLATVSILRFLAVMLLFQLHVFEEVNEISFKHIPDEPSSPSLSEDDLESDENKKQQSTIPTKMRSYSNHKKLSTFKRLSTFTSSNKKIKFLTTLIKNINASQIVSDTSLLDTLKVILILLRLSSSIYLCDPYSPIVFFSRRLLFVLGDSLQLCEESQGKRNPVLARCLARNRSTHTKLQVAFFPPGFIMDTDQFMAKITQFTRGKQSDLKHLRTVTEGFKLFFSIPNVPSTCLEVVLKTTDFLKETLREMSDIILNSSPDFGATNVEFVNQVLVGEALGDTDTFKISKSTNPISLSKTSSTLQQSASTKSGLKYSPSSSSISSNSSSHGERMPSSAVRPELIAPRGRRSSGSFGTMFTKAKPIPSPDDEKQSAMTKSHIEGLHKSMKSPLKFSRSRQSSNESLPPFSAQSLPVSNRFEAKTTLVLTKKSAYVEDARVALVNIMSVYKRVIKYYFVSYDGYNRVSVGENFDQIIRPIFVGLIDSHPVVQEVTKSFTAVIASYIVKAEHKDHSNCIHYVMYRGSAYLVTLLSSTLFNLSLEDKKREELLEVMAIFLDIRKELFSSFEKADSLEKLRPIETETFNTFQGTIGRALFASLCSHDTKIHRLLRTCFKALTQELDAHDCVMGYCDKVNRFNRLFFNAMCRDSYVSTGAVAFQRRLRSDILKYVKLPDKILFDTLDLVYKRWYELSERGNLNNSEASSFRNYAGLIAASCGVFLILDSHVVNEYSYLLESRSTVIEYINYFIGKQCSWLNDANLLTRENSKDILSVELHPLAFKLLFEALKTRIDALEQLDLSASENDAAFLLLEQVILILRTLLERDDAREELILVSLELLSILEQLFKLVESMSHNSIRFYKAIIHMSKMIRSFEHAEKSLCISGHLLVKNKWLRIVISWFKSTIFKDYDVENLGRPHREMDLQRRDIDYLHVDTSIESSKALAYITRDLMLEGPLSISESELKRSKAVIFGNYFGTLLKGLEKTASVENFPTTLRHKISVLNENIITTLTNLLDANVDVGFQYALPIGYSKNQNIKLAFMRVFINIISNFDIHKTKAMEKKNELIEVYVSKVMKYPFILAIIARACPANDIDALASSMLSVFQIKNCSHIVVAELVKDEIQRASRYAEILRRNSCATRALSMFSRLKGTGYLVKTLKPIFTEIIDKNEYFEIEKLNSDHPDAEKNVQLFVKYQAKLIGAITNITDDFPPEFFFICRIIYSCVEKKFEGHGKLAVGSFIFLRYFCPAIVSPDAENIVDIVDAKQKRTFVLLAKITQNIANGSINTIKWPLLQSQAEFLKECSSKVSNYLLSLACPDRSIKIKMQPARGVTFEDFTFLHKFIYQYGLVVRQQLINHIKTEEDFVIFKELAKETDTLLSALGQPRMEFRNEIPAYIRDNMDEYPGLYDFMSRHSMRTFDFKDTYTFIHEAISAEGFPVIVFSLKLLQKHGGDPEALTYRVFQVYSKIWASKHYFVMDCTGSTDQKADDKKIFTFFFNLIPDEAARNCVGFYYYNMTEAFLNWWLPIFRAHNPYLVPYKTPHHFINSDASPETVKNLRLTEYSNEVYADVRVTLHDVSLYDSKKGRFTPVTLKIGNKYAQMISDTPRRLKINGIDDVVSVKFNNVYEIADLESTVVSFETGVSSEFTINFFNSPKMIFCSSKYLEIIKIFYYAQARIEEEYEDGFGMMAPNNDTQNDESETREILGHLLLVVYAGFCSGDEDVKAVSYNLLAVTQEAFELDFGCKLRVSPEVHVPHDISAFCYSVFKVLAKTAPQLSFVVWKSVLEGLSGIIEDPYVPHVITTLEPWVGNLYKHVYLANDEQGPENVSSIIRTLIKLSVADPRLTMIYNQCIWSSLILETDLVGVLVDEIINHSLDRESEGADWKNGISLITRVSTVEVCSEIIHRILKLTRSFLPSLKLEASTNSWSELIILVNVCVALFFDSLLLAEMFLPEVLYIVSLLIDVGPSELRSSLHKLLMNVSQSLSTNETLTDEQRARIDDINSVFARHKMKFMFGFSQDKGRLLQNFSASSFLTKFTTLECLIQNIITLIENASITDSSQWKAKFSKYVMDSVFNVDSFLSARAVMIIGIMGQVGISESLCKSLLRQTIKVIAEPYVSDELLFFTISHAFTYSKIVQGLKEDSTLLRQLFWLATTFTQSSNTIFYHGGMLFMANAVKRIFSLKEKDGSSLQAILFEGRSFAEKDLIELESMSNLRWTEENFPHIILNMISKGLLIPYIKVNAVECLSLFFSLSKQKLNENKRKDYMCYLLFLYLVLRPSKLKALLDEEGLMENVVHLDDQNCAPSELLDWLESDSKNSLVALYQASVYFASGVSDELSKIRYLLLVNNMAKKKPLKLFKIYSLIRNELRRISALDVQSEFPNLVFSIAQTMVKHEEYFEHDDSLDETIAYLEKRGLGGLAMVEFESSSMEIMSNIRTNPYAVYEAKKLTLTILSKMAGGC
ncbi:LAMI_0C06964g1_1 [Lachancea mirantina]|uniref:LAMI_0C06964g1_1 n=1 Tax=Lachancea mirantina TaxID=1230905 RepID=A0A1G4J3K0_9SACH|nr:LAMI_0C06964g1_1 [Lachancea mirantina]